MRRKIIINLIIIAIVTLVLVLLIFFTNGINELPNLLASLRYRWILAAFGCMGIYWLSASLVLHHIIRMFKEKWNLGDSIRLNMIGGFFNAITPLNSGGQLAQAYILVKNGIKAGQAALVLVIRSMVYTLVQFFFTFAALVLGGDVFIGRIPNFFAIALIGFLINALIAVLYVLFFLKADAARWVVRLVIFLLRRLKFIKRIDEAKQKLESECDNFCAGAGILRNNISVMANLLFMQAIQLAVYFIIAYFIYLAFNGMGSISKLKEILVSQVIILLILSFFPTPGSVGGAEGVSYLFFSLFFQRHIVIPAIFVWRMLTYYTNIVIGGLFTVAAPEKPLA